MLNLKPLQKSPEFTFLLNFIFRAIIPYRNKKATLFDSQLSQIEEANIIYDLKMGRSTIKEKMYDILSKTFLRKL